MQCSLIWKLYEFELNYNSAKTTKNICYAKGEDTVDYSTVGRVFAYGLGRPGFNPRSYHTKDFKNGTCYLLA